MKQHRAASPAIEEEWLSARQASVIVHLPEKKIADVAARGLLTVREGLEDLDIMPRYSKSSCEALARRLTKPARAESLAALS